MSLQQLYDTLLSINNDKKTGKLYIYVREKSSKRSGTILVGRGEIFGISYFEKTGRAAFENLLSIGIEEVQSFTPLAAAGVRGGDRRAGRR
ncbi:MAG: hypothetical protein WAV07_20525 [Candidatus Contendobacter sp.]